MGEGYEGTILSLDERGFGFIKLKEFDQNVFFHARNVRHIRFEQLRPRDKVVVSDVIPNEVTRRDGSIQSGYKAKDVYLVQ